MLLLADDPACSLAVSCESRASELLSPAPRDPRDRDRGGARPARQQPTKEHRHVTVSRPAAVVILAAGAGTRMKSQLPKVLHPICGASMLDYVLAAARELDPAELIVVVGHGRRQVAAHL